MRVTVTQIHIHYAITVAPGPVFDVSPGDSLGDTSDLQLAWQIQLSFKRFLGVNADDTVAIYVRGFVFGSV